MAETSETTNGIDARTKIFFAQLLNLESIFITAEAEARKMEENATIDENADNANLSDNPDYNAFIKLCKTSGEKIVNMLFHNRGIAVSTLDDLDIEVLIKIVELSRSNNLIEEQRPVVAEEIVGAIVKEKERRDIINGRNERLTIDFWKKGNRLEKAFEEIEREILKMEAETRNQKLKELKIKKKPLTIDRTTRIKPKSTKRREYNERLTKRKIIGEAIVRKYFPYGIVTASSVTDLEDDQLTILARIVELSNDENEREDRKPVISPVIIKVVEREQTLRELRKAGPKAEKQIRKTWKNGKTTRDTGRSRLAGYKPEEI